MHAAVPQWRGGGDDNAVRFRGRIGRGSPLFTGYYAAEKSLFSPETLAGWLPA